MPMIDNDYMMINGEMNEECPKYIGESKDNTKTSILCKTRKHLQMLLKCDHLEYIDTLRLEIKEPDIWDDLCNAIKRLPTLLDIIIVSRCCVKMTDNNCEQFIQTCIDCPQLLEIIIEGLRLESGLLFQLFSKTNLCKLFVRTVYIGVKEYTGSLTNNLYELQCSDHPLWNLDIKKEKYVRHLKCKPFQYDHMKIIDTLDQLPNLTSIHFDHIQSMEQFEAIVEVLQQRPLIRRLYISSSIENLSHEDVENALNSTYITKCTFDRTGAFRRQYLKLLPMYKRTFVVKSMTKSAMKR